jgi:hypothetical protein
MNMLLNVNPIIVLTIFLHVSTNNAHQASRYLMANAYAVLKSGRD